MSRIDNLIGLLRLLKASGGEIETRIRVQKEAYLIGLKFPGFFDIRDFEYHHYGPYSRSLSEALQFAVSSNLIDEKDESPSDGSFTKYSYFITDSGTRAIDAVYSADEFVDDFADFLKTKDWRTLELASTIRFLEINEVLGRDAAIQKALLLKPQTANKQHDALTVLDAM